LDAPSWKYTKVGLGAFMVLSFFRTILPPIYINDDAKSDPVDDSLTEIVKKVNDLFGAKPD
jgi:hypothetical protein